MTAPGNCLREPMKSVHHVELTYALIAKKLMFITIKKSQPGSFISCLSASDTVLVGFY